MNLLNSYDTALLGALLIVLTVMLQALIASGVKAKQPGAIPGKISAELSHDSFVFRAHRTFMNSLENVPVMLALVFIAVLAGANQQWTTILVWIFALARLAHMLLYYAIATETNPSPRSWFFLLALLSQWVLAGFCVAALIN